MRILITNDDGINAPGLEVLTAIAEEISGPGGEVWTVAPAFEQSGVAHCISYTHPMMILKLGPRTSGFATEAAAERFDPLAREAHLRAMQGREPRSKETHMLNNIGIPGLLLIAVVILVLFGRGKVSSLMGEVGKGITAFKKGVKDGSEEIEKASADQARDVTPDKDKA